MSFDGTTQTNESRKLTARRLARHALFAERLLMGIVFVVFGLGGVLGLLPQHASSESSAVGGMLMKTGFLFPLLKGAEVLLEQYVHSGARQA